MCLSYDVPFSNVFFWCYNVFLSNVLVVESFLSQVKYSICAKIERVRKNTSLPPSANKVELEEKCGDITWQKREEIMFKIFSLKKNLNVHVIVIVTTKTV